MPWRELGELKVTEGRNEEMIDDLAISFVRFGRDFRADRFEPITEPDSHGDSIWVDVLAGIDRAKQPPQLLLRILAVTSHGRGGCLALAGGWVSSEAIAQLERANGALAYVP